MNRILTLLLCGSSLLSLHAQPKLIVGVVVDQMRTDYIYRYWDKYEEDGIKRIMKEGYFCKNAHFNYVPTYTGPGHASIYTGTSPMNHGIIANDWFERQTGDTVYCASDDRYTTIGSSTEAGQMSPHRMISPGLGDAIRTSTIFKGKSIGISIKDRGAILPAGHSANAAYWVDYSNGSFVSSSYYTDKLPKWLNEFNNAKHPDRLMKNEWKTMLPIGEYTESTADDTPYEIVPATKDKPTFPYNLAAQVKAGSYYAFAASPYGNTYLRMLAEKVLTEEKLGQDEHTDLLAISFSSTDMVGHAFGPQSIEMEDTYLRFDREVALLLNMLDEQVGAGNYTLFFTADHAAAQVPAFLKDQNIPAGTLNSISFRKQLSAYLNKKLGSGNWIRNYSNQQVFLNHDFLDQKGINAEVVVDQIRAFALNHEAVSGVYSKDELRAPIPSNRFTTLAQNGWNQSRSGDVLIQYKPGWIAFRDRGTTHGSSYNYDTHVPILFYGYGVTHGESIQPVDITQIVPTICLISSIAFPDASDIRPISGVLGE